MQIETKEVILSLLCKYRNQRGYIIFAIQRNPLKILYLEYNNILS
jgi:hypothetical protein